MKKTSLTKLTISNAKFYAYHGVKPEERELGCRYEVDLEMYYDATRAIINDSVNDALNYEEALFCISEVMEGESLNLIETIANEILNMLNEKFPEMLKATVRIRKIGVPLRAIVDYVESEQTIERQFNENA